MDVEVTSQIDSARHSGVDEDEESVLRRADIFGKFRQGAGCHVNEHRRRQLVDLLSHLEPGEIDTVVTGFTLFTRAAEARGHGTPNRPCAEDSNQQ